MPGLVFTLSTTPNRLRVRSKVVGLKDFISWPKNKRLALVPLFVQLVPLVWAYGNKEY